MSCEMTTKEAIERFEEARKKLNSLMFLSSLQRTVYLEALAMGMPRKYEDRRHKQEESKPLEWKTKHCKDCRYFSAEGSTCENPYLIYTRNGNHKRPSDSACVRGFKEA